MVVQSNPVEQIGQRINVSRSAEIFGGIAEFCEIGLGKGGLLLEAGGDRIQQFLTLKRLGGIVIRPQGHASTQIRASDFSGQKIKEYWP